MAIRDDNLIVRATSDGAFVSSVPEVWSIDMGAGTALEGLSLQINVPAAVTGCDPVLCVEIYASTASVAATTDAMIGARTGMVKGAEYIVPFSTPKRSVAFCFDVTSTTTTAFSIITAFITEPVAHDWTRDTNWY